MVRVRHSLWIAAMGAGSLLLAWHANPPSGQTEAAEEFELAAVPGESFVGAQSTIPSALPQPIVTRPQPSAETQEDLTGGTTSASGTSAFVITQITTTPAGPISFAMWAHGVSADARFLLITSMADLAPPQNPDQSRELFLYDRVEETFEQLTDTTGWGVFGMAISADTMKIALVSPLDLDNSGDTDGTRELFLLDRIAGIERITGGPQAVELYGSISADGSKIVFFSKKDLDDPPGGNVEGTLEVFLFDGTCCQQLSDSDGSSLDVSGWPVISADGSRVAFVSSSDDFLPNPEQSREIVRIVLETGEINFTTSTLCPSTAGGSTPCESTAPAISADGREVVFVSNADYGGPNGNLDGNLELFMIQRVWPGIETIVQQTDRAGSAFGPYARKPAINQSGTKIAFLSEADYGANLDGNFELYFLNPTPPNPLSPPLQVTDSVGTVNWSNTTVAISRDGGLIVFTSEFDLDPAVGNADGSTEVFIAMPVNPPPILDPIGDQSSPAEELLSFTLNASDPDNDPLSFSVLDLPAGATFTDHGNGTATFAWTPTEVGTHFVTFIVWDDDSGEDSTDAGTSFSDWEGLRIVITAPPPNQPPVLDPIGDQMVAEDALLTFPVTASDPNKDLLTLTAEQANGDPLEDLGATFTDNGDGTGLFSWTPDFTQAGDYQVTVTSSDGTLDDAETFTIIVTNTNQPPVLTPIGDQMVEEDQPLTVEVSATDPNKDLLTLTAEQANGDPIEDLGATFIDHGDGTGTFEWTPDFTQAGDYQVTVTSSDGELDDAETFTITVLNLNQPPWLDPIGKQMVPEGQLLVISVTAQDPDGQEKLVLEAENIPPGATFTDEGQGIGTFEWTPDFTQAGEHLVIFRATDGLETAEEPVSITVTNTNQPPVLAPIEDQSVREEELLTFLVTASDPDESDFLTLSANNLPSGAVFGDFGNGVGKFKWTPNNTQAGVYFVTFTVSDGQLKDLEAITITVTNTNQPPVLDPIGDQMVSEGETLKFGVKATDLDGQDLFLEAEPLPPGAVFVDWGQGRGTFGWTPIDTQVMDYPVTFSATDGMDTVYEKITITVSHTNLPPVFDPIPNQTVHEGQMLRFTVRATDANGDSLMLRPGELPAGAVFFDLGNGVGEFKWVPTSLQAGVYVVTFYAWDGTDVAKTKVRITVLNWPSWSHIGP